MKKGSKEALNWQDTVSFNEFCATSFCVDGNARRQRLLDNQLDQRDTKAKNSRTVRTSSVEYRQCESSSEICDAIEGKPQSVAFDGWMLIQDGSIITHIKSVYDEWNLGDQRLEKWNITRKKSGAAESGKKLELK